MFKYRMISFPIMIGVLWAIFWGGQIGEYIFLGVAVLASFLAAAELSNLARRMNYDSYLIPVATACGAIAGLAAAGKLGLSGVQLLSYIVILLLALLIALLLQLALDKGGGVWRKIFTSLAIFLAVNLVSLPLLFVWSYVTAPLMLLYLIAVTKSMDTGGYIFGMLSSRLLPGGNHKIMPKVSPKKSWEGTLGGLLFSVIASLVFYWCGCELFSGVAVYIVNGILLGWGSLAGDLTESALKRRAGIKDSANYIPGMGGILDVIDSFIYNALIFLAVLLIVR
ncbi:MAG: phosphatidate cytidylyltransferase [Lentisphaeria bacterium]|nr:phosphatidate cytidylyltransferase [Lentisphaeria bacterium]